MISWGTPKAKANSWPLPDTHETKAWGAKRIRYPCSPRPKRCLFAVSSIDPRSGVANALNRPPGKYDRKIKTQRNRRGLAQAVDYVAQFVGKRRTLPRLEIQLHPTRKGRSLRGCWTGDAWSSSVRGLNCSLQWGNERNPRCLLPIWPGETAPSRERKVGMTPDQHVPLIPWAARIIQWAVQRVAMP